MCIDDYKNLKVGDFFSNINSINNTLQHFKEGTIFKVTRIRQGGQHLGNADSKGIYIQFTCDDIINIGWTGEFGLNSYNSSQCFMCMDLIRDEKLKTILG